MLHIVDGRQEVRHLLPAHYDRQLSGLFASRDDVLDHPGTLECDGVEEPQGRHRDDDGTGGKVLVIDEVQQIHPDLGWPEKLG